MIKQVIFNISVIAILLCNIPAGQCAVPVQITSSISKPVVAKGQTVVLTFNVMWEGNPDAIIIEHPRNPDCYLLDVEKITQNNCYALYPDQSLNRVTFRYTLRATDTGKGRIGYFAIEYTEKDAGIKRVKKSQSFDISIMSKSRYLLRQASNMVSIGLILAMIAGCVFIIIHIYRKKKAKARADSTLNLQTQGGLEQRALDQLKEALKYKISGDTYKFFDTIRAVLRRYFDARYTTPQATQADTDTANANQIPQKILMEYKEIIAVCNRIKFSGENLPPEELDSWYNRAKKLVAFYMEHIKKEHTDKKIQNITLRDNGGK